MCSFFNLLDLPAVVFPVTKVDPSVDVLDYKPISDEDKTFVDDCESQSCFLSRLPARGISPYG